MTPAAIRSAILEKLQSLPPERLAEVADFIAFVSQQDAERTLRESVSRASNIAFEEVWDNDDDAIYDRL
jgi:hypothetical protein